MTKHRSPERPSGQPPIRPGDGDERTLSERVVEELAAAQNVTPIEMDWALNDSIDPDALDALFAPRHDGTQRTGDGYVEFSSNGYRVAVPKNGDIRLEPATDPSV